MIIDILLAQVLGRGGLETVLVHVSRKLREKGHRIRFVFNEPPLIVEWMKELDEVYICANIQRLTEPDGYSHEAFARSYRTLLNKIGFPDVTLGSFRPLFTYVARLAFGDLPRSQHPPILSWIHGPPEAYHAHETHFNQADAHLAISYAVGQKIKTYHASAPLFFVGNPIYKLENSGDETTVVRPDHLKIVYLGHIDATVKGIPVLLESCSRIKGEWQLDLYGEGEERLRYTQQCLTMGIADRVRWHGWKDDVWSHLNEASLLVLPSNSEGFGMVLTEALQRGIPVVASQTDGAKEVVLEDYNGWTFPIGDVDALSAIFQEIVDGKRILPTADQCRRSVQIYHSEQVIANFEHALQTMIAYKKHIRDYEASGSRKYEEELEEKVGNKIPQILAYYNEQKWDQVLEAGEALYSQIPAFSELAFLLGHTHMQLQHYNRAHFYFKQVLMTTPLPAYQQFAQNNIRTIRMFNLEAAHDEQQEVKRVAKPQEVTKGGQRMFGTYIGNNMMLIQTTYGGMLTISASDRSIMPILVTTGSHEVPLTNYLSRHVQAGETFVDIGSNVGYFTVLAARRVGARGKVIAYEANPITYSFVQQNVTMNWVEHQVQLKNVAVYAEPTTLPFYRSRSLEGDSSLKPLEKLKEDDKFDVINIPAVRLDDDLQQIPSIDWVKIDIEGGECQAFKGMLGFIQARKIKRIIFEWNTLALGDEADDFLQLLRQIQQDTGCHFFSLNYQGDPVPYDINNLRNLTFHPYVVIQF